MQRLRRVNVAKIPRTSRWRSTTAHPCAAAFARRIIGGGWDPGQALWARRAWCRAANPHVVCSQEVAPMIAARPTAFRTHTSQGSEMVLADLMST